MHPFYKDQEQVHHAAQATALLVLMHPQGGSLAKFWQPNQYYGTVDLIYSESRYRSGDRFCEAQVSHVFVARLASHHFA